MVLKMPCAEWQYVTFPYRLSREFELCVSLLSLCGELCSRLNFGYVSRCLVVFARRCRNIGNEKGSMTPVGEKRFEGCHVGLSGCAREFAAYSLPVAWLAESSANPVVHS